MINEQGEWGKPRRQGQRRKQEQRQMISIDKLLDGDMRKKPRRVQERRKAEGDRRGRE